MIVTKIKETEYEVTSESKKHIIYKINVRRDGTHFCTCRAFQYHSSTCKHIQAVEQYKETEWEVYKNGEINVL